jgi:hypothetical protein
VQQLIAGATGRRVIEGHYISCDSFWIREIKGHRVLGFKFHWRKGRGCVGLDCAMVETSELESNAVAWVLHWMELRGMIRSAIDCYNFVGLGRRGKIPVDTERFETADDLLSSISTALHRNAFALGKRICGSHDGVYGEVLEKVAGGHHRRAQGLVDENRSAQEDSWTHRGIYDCVALERRKHGKEPFYVSTYDGHLTTFPLNYNDRADSMRRSMSVAGYKGHKHQYVGQTGNRKAYILESIYTNKDFVDTGAHLDTNALNSSQIRHANYVEHNQVRRQVPANILHSNVCPEVARAAVEDMHIEPLYTREDVFDQSRTVHKDPLPSAVSFLQSRRAPASGRTTYPCPYVGCPFTSPVLGGVMMHLKSSNQKPKIALCEYRDSGRIECYCGKSIVDGDGHTSTSSRRWLDHWRITCPEARGIHSVATRDRKRKFIHPVATGPGGTSNNFASATEGVSAAHVCQQCGHKFVKKAGLAYHLRVTKTCPASAAYNPTSPGCNKTYWDDEAKMKLLEEYCAAHDGIASLTCRGPRSWWKGVSLGHWISNQRAKHVNGIKGGVTDWLLVRLAAVGVKWALSSLPVLLRSNAEMAN